MADEQEQSPVEAGTEDLQQTMPSVHVDAPAATGAQPTVRARWSGLVLILAILAVLLTIAGIYGQTKKDPEFLSLGLGLLLWGILDLIGQRRGLIVWKGAKAGVGNTVNLLRGIGLMSIGLWLCLVAMGSLNKTSTAMVSNVAAWFLVIYLGITLLSEILVKGVKLSGQAFLLVALVLQLVSFTYFTLPFTYGWAAIFAGLAYAAGAWAIFGGVMHDNPALSRAVLLATLALGLPFATFTMQQMFMVEVQPVFTPSVNDRRMRLVLANLGEDAGQMQWAPVNTHLGQPGDIRFTDKLAFTDYKEDEPGLGLFIQKEDQPQGELTWVKSGEEAKLTAFSEDGRLLAYTDIKEEGASPRLGVMGPSGIQVSPWPEGEAPEVAKKETVKEKHQRQKKEKEEAAAIASSYGVKRPYAGSVAPGPEHGQVWRGLGKQLYFAAPEGAPKAEGSAVKMVDLSTEKVITVRAGRGFPAISPDGTSLLSVGFARNARYLEMADGASGERAQRIFEWRKEKRYFPAWNASQTRVIFLKNGKLHTMKSNGTDQKDFDPEGIDSRLWLSDKTVPFTLQWKESGERWKIYRSDAMGRKESLIYEAKAQGISAPQWSPDGKRIAFIEHNPGSSTVMTLGPHGEWPRSFFNSPDSLRELKWSPDSLKLAWLVDRLEDEKIHAQEVWTAVLAGLEPLKVYNTHANLSSLTWAPQGKHLAVEAAHEWRFLGLHLVKPDLHDVVMVDLVDNKARMLTRYGLMARQPAFSPQGVAIAYFTDNSPWSPAMRRERSSALVISQLY